MAATAAHARWARTPFRCVRVSPERGDSERGVTGSTGDAASAGILRAAARDPRGSAGAQRRRGRCATQSCSDRGNAPRRASPESAGRAEDGLLGNTRRHPQDKGEFNFTLEQVYSFQTFSSTTRLSLIEFGKSRNERRRKTGRHEIFRTP
ncbi:hypothetical protein MTO96_011821 [Rhipicephalus appendiculatus]